MSDWRIHFKAETAEGEHYQGEASLGGYFTLEAAGRHAITTAIAKLGVAAKTTTKLSVTIEK